MLYPIFILAVFLIVQLLTVLGTRKVVLDQNRKQLLETVNAGNKVYTNEELSTKISNLENKSSELEQLTKDLKAREDSLPIGEYTLFSGKYTTTSSTYTNFFRANWPFRRVDEMFGSNVRGKYKFCVDHATDAGPAKNLFAYIRFADVNDSSKSLEFKLGSEGPFSNVGETRCTDLNIKDFDKLDHFTISARVDSPRTFVIYRVFLLVY